MSKLKLKLNVIGLIFLSCIVIFYLIWAGRRQHPIVTLLEMKPASHEVTSRGFFYTRKLVYLKGDNSPQLYEKIINKIESSDFIHGMNTADSVC